MNYPGFAEYFPEFLFNYNSQTPQDTSLYYMWDLNTYNITSKKIQIIGFYEPSEKKAIGKKRAEAILEGLIKRGANKECFVLKSEVYKEYKLEHGLHIDDNKADHFFKKGAIINKQYIDSLTGDRKEAATQILRAVRLEWYYNK